MRRRRGAFFLIYALIALALGHGSRATAQQTVKNPDTVVTLRTGDPRTLDPAAAYDEASQEVVYPNVYETLIMYAGGNLSRFVPVLATQVPSLGNGLISKDGLVYTFPIRRGSQSLSSLRNRSGRSAWSGRRYLLPQHAL
jgi:ABC-type transport system substrate-binding protein